MRQITLSDFHKQYFPTLSQRDMARKIGITDCAYTKIKISEISTSSIFFKKTNEFMNLFNCILILDSPKFAMEKKYKKEITRLELKIKDLEQKITDLNNQIMWYNNINSDLKIIYKKLKEKYEK